jgi:hypothetical protein
MEHPFLMFLDHTQRRSTVGRTPLQLQPRCILVIWVILDHSLIFRVIMPDVVLIQLSSRGWAHSCSKHVEDSNKRIIEEIVRQFGYLPEQELPTRTRVTYQNQSYLPEPKLPIRTRVSYLPEPQLPTRTRVSYLPEPELPTRIAIHYSFLYYFCKNVISHTGVFHSSALFISQSCQAF